MGYTKNKTIEILNRNGLKANKRFGQNFLIDDQILMGIVEAADITENDIVIEIGPGLGNLTEYLLKQAKKVISFEIDPNMIEVLKERFTTDKLDIVHNDILKVNIDEYITEIVNNMDNFNGKVKVVANLPYYITTPIIFNLFEKATIVSDITIMIQKEVAQRIVATPGGKEYGVLSVMCEYYSESEIKIIVPPESFIPAPNVESAVITLVKKDKYKVDNTEKFNELIKAAFSQRRKKMSNSISSNKNICTDKNKLIEIYNKLNIAENARAEEISIEKFIELYEELKNK